MSANSQDRRDGPEVAVQTSSIQTLQIEVPVMQQITRRNMLKRSAGSAVVLWWIWFDPHRWISGLTGQWAALAAIVLLVLLIPAGAAFIGYLTLKEILDLPKKLKSAASEAAGHAKDVAVPTEERKGGRLFGFFRAIWAARGLVLDSKGAWGKAVAAARLTRLASLPFVLGLLITFALNFVVIGVAMIAVALSIAI